MNKLRHVEFDGYQLITWDTNRRDALGKCILRYEFYKPGSSQPLFQGEDFACSPMDPVDSDEALRSLLGFLTLRPGDTDSDYFDDYTPEQLDFANNDAEYLQIWADEESNLPFNEK